MTAESFDTQTRFILSACQILTCKHAVCGPFCRPIVPLQHGVVLQLLAYLSRTTLIYPAPREFELNKASHLCISIAEAEVNFLGSRDLDIDRIALVSLANGIGEGHRPTSNSCHQDGMKVRCAHLRHVLAPGRTAQPSHNCLQATSAASARGLTPPHYSPMLSIPVWKVEPSLQFPCRLARSGPPLDRRSLLGLVHDRFLDISDASSAAYDIANPSSNTANGTTAMARRARAILTW